MVEKTHSAGHGVGQGAGWWPSLYDPLRNIGEKIADWFAPRSEASAVEDSYEITMELPGVKAEDVDVSLDNNTLTVKGEKRFQREERGRSYFFSEREYGAFQRSFRLPADADHDSVSAEFKDGLLSIRLRKAGPPPETGKRIKVTTG